MDYRDKWKIVCDFDDNVVQLKWFDLMILILCQFLFKYFVACLMIAMCLPLGVLAYKKGNIICVTRNISASTLYRVSFVATNLSNQGKVSHFDES